ncbi:MAG: hypothetical protein RLZZ292_3985 [Bacteroidota bacterium]|jgi:hypothetical protein
MSKLLQELIFLGYKIRNHIKLISHFFFYDHFY